jgi:hypothetical protein
MPGEGNVRVGFLVAGLLLVVFGWGGAVILNVYLHTIAPPNGIPVLLWRVYPGWSLYDGVLAFLGVLATLVGLGMLYLARHKPSGSVRLPDTEGELRPDTVLP